MKRQRGELIPYNPLKKVTKPSNEGLLGKERLEDTLQVLVQVFEGNGWPYLGAFFMAILRHEQGIPSWTWSHWTLREHKALRQEWLGTHPFKRTFNNMSNFERALEDALYKASRRGARKARYKRRVLQKEARILPQRSVDGKDAGRFLK